MSLWMAALPFGELMCFIAVILLKVGGIANLAPEQSPKAQIGLLNYQKIQFGP